MSSPFSTAVFVSQPLWSATAVSATAFSVFPTVGIVSDEVGYGQGGYGLDGYDAPPINISSASTPNWAAVTVR